MAYANLEDTAAFGQAKSEQARANDAALPHGMMYADAACREKKVWLSGGEVSKGHLHAKSKR